MQENKQSESGSMMLEVIAVLSLLAIMTPIVYQQALKRNIEVSNINIADEMRLVKDSVKAYLDANAATIAANCEATSSGVIKNCNTAVSLTDVCNYTSAIGASCGFNCTGCQGADQDEETSYNLNVYAYYDQKEMKDSDGSTVDTIRKPVAFGLISLETQPILKKKRAMKIASLIGAAGGVCDSETQITGSYGVWELNGGEDVADFSNICFDNETSTDEDPQYTVVVRTDM